MQIEVLRYKHPDYEVIVRSQDIRYSWERFKGRIEYSRLNDTNILPPSEYCNYTSKEHCSLYIYSPIDNNIHIFDNGVEWDGLWPVIFETCKYQIRILFHEIDKDSIPRIHHAKKSIVDSFYYDQELSNIKEKSLTGEINFINEPGSFRLEFSYEKNGILNKNHVSFDVVSPKLDTKNDYKKLLSDINKEYENVIYRYLSITLQQFAKGVNNSEITWMSAFQNIVEDYLKNIRRVILNPHSKIVDCKTSKKVYQIKFWPAILEEQYNEVCKNTKLEEHFFSHNQTISTHNTMENRFVKYTLQNIGHKLSRILDTILNSKQEGLSETHRQMWVDYQISLKKLIKHPFFNTIGKFEGMNKESLVLQNRIGYQQIYKDWLKLKRGIDFYNGSANIGTLQIWEVYELWCFIKMKKLIAEVLGIDYSKPSHEHLVIEPEETLLNPFTNSSLEHVVEFQYPTVEDSDSEERKRYLVAHEGEIVTLHYQHTFNRKSGGGEYGMNINTATTEQRPDIVLNIRKPSGEVVLTYLYDAKYRVLNDKNLDNDFERLDVEENINLGVGDYPPPDTINQMHRYRDAIYYSKEHNPYCSKEVIGGYILFPGRGNDEQIKQRYYSKSIENVNIGAFPLLPNYDSLLKEHLEQILIKYTSTEIHVSKSKPQRTLAYITEEEKKGTDDLVMIALAGNNEKRKWTFDTLWYNIPIDKIANAPWNLAKYLLLHTNDETNVGNICEIVKSKHEVWTREKLQQFDYPGTPSKSAYFMLRIKKPTQTKVDLQNIKFNVKNIKSIYWGNHKMAFFLARLSDLQHKKI